MARWGKMTERGCYTLTKELKKKLRDVANETQIAESKHVRNALALYFEHLELQKQRQCAEHDCTTTVQQEAASGSSQGTQN